MRWSLLIVFLMLMSGCSNETPPTPESQANPSPSQATPSIPNKPISQGRPTSGPTAPPNSDQLSPDQFATNGEYVIAKHAADFKMDPGKITVVSDEEVTWSSSAKGCPKPGMMYLDVMTPGFRVIISVDGVEYSYHADKSRKFFLCERPSGRGYTEPLK